MDLLRSRDLARIGGLQVLNSLRISYCFTAVPLHFLDSGWALWPVGVIFSSAAFVRLPVSFAVARYGEWLCAPSIVLATLASAWLVLEPGSQLVVCVGIGATMASQNKQAFAGLAFRLFEEASDQQRALRVVTFSQVVGYSAGPLVGGVLYEFWGFRACAGFQLASAASQCALLTGLQVLRQAAKKSGEQRQAGARPALSTTLKVILLADFANHFTYTIEWATYAAYFRQVYAWGGAWTGFAQMVGDLCAAGLLFASALAGIKVRRPGEALAPLFLAYAILFVMLADTSRFGVAVLGQVFLGSVYVFAVQAVQELFVLHAHDPQGYQHLLVLSAVALSLGMGLGSFGSLWVYDKVGRVVPYQVAAAASAALSLFLRFALRDPATAGAEAKGEDGDQGDQGEASFAPCVAGEAQAAQAAQAADLEVAV